MLDLADADDRELAVLALGRRMLLGDANDSKRIAPALWRFRVEFAKAWTCGEASRVRLGRCGVGLRLREVRAGRIRLRYFLAKLLDEGTAAPKGGRGPKARQELTIAGRPLSVDDAEAQEAKVGASL